MLFIGIDPAVQRNEYCMAVLDEDRKIQALSTEKPRSVYSYVAGVTQGIVGINSFAKYQHFRRKARVDPLGKPHFLSETERKKRSSLSDQNAVVAGRLGEKVVRIQEGIRHLGYGHVSDNAQSRRFFLSQAEEVFLQIASGRALPVGSDASRWQRQLLLLDQEIPLPDVMQYFEEVTRFRILQGTLPEELIYQHAELNAVLLSWLGWLERFQPARIKVLDDNSVAYKQQPSDQGPDEDA